MVYTPTPFPKESTSLKTHTWEPPPESPEQQGPHLLTLAGIETGAVGVVPDNFCGPGGHWGTPIQPSTTAGEFTRATACPKPRTTSSRPQGTASRTVRPHVPSELSPPPRPSPALLTRPQQHHHTPPETAQAAAAAMRDARSRPSEVTTPAFTHTMASAAVATPAASQGAVAGRRWARGFRRLTGCRLQQGTSGPVNHPRRVRVLPLDPRHTPRRTDHGRQGR